jgi:DNA primase
MFMYDGDAPGYDGAAQGAKAIRALGIAAIASCCPYDGRDPKDMTILEIKSHLEAAWNNLQAA